MTYIRVVHDGKPARLHIANSEFFLEPLGQNRVKVSAEDAKKYLDHAYEIQRMKGAEVWSQATSIWLLQPAVKDISCELERIASGMEEAEMRIRAHKVKLASVQGNYIQSASAAKGEGHTVVKREPIALPPTREPVRMPEPKPAPVAVKVQDKPAVMTVVKPAPAVEKSPEKPVEKPKKIMIG